MPRATRLQTPALLPNTLLGLVDKITEELQRGNQEDVVVLDFSKAFAKVSQSLLVHKLRRNGIGRRINSWIKAFLTDRQLSVTVEGAKSDPVAVESGVPQGSVLGPALFLIYM
ncbi:hypothetical protein ACOMHN_020521 [Nucella lapillus]